MNKRKISDILQILAYILFVVLVYNFVGGYELRIMNISIIYGIVALGLVVMLGMTGMLNFAGISFMGIGSYVVANVCTGRHGFELSSITGLVLAVLISAVFGCLISIALLRLNGTFFTFSTIALVQIMQTIFINYIPLFGGSSGISNIDTFSAGDFVVKGNSKWFLFVACIFAVVALLVIRLGRTRLGRAMYSVRDDEIVAQTMGINVFRTKMIAFTIQAALCGLAGGLYAMLNKYVGSDLFTWNKASTIVIMAMVGGINNPLGALLGSIIVTALPEVFRNLQQFLRLAYGIAIILLMIFLPMGIMSIGDVAKVLVGKAKKKRAAQMASSEAKGGR